MFTSIFKQDHYYFLTQNFKNPIECFRFGFLFGFLPELVPYLAFYWVDGLGAFQIWHKDRQISSTFGFLYAKIILCQIIDNLH
jgi:hypothetical protein